MQKWSLAWGKAGAVIGLVLFWVGCASTPKVDWDSRLGHYSFDQAVVEMGPPDRSSDLSDGSRVAEWFLRSGSAMSFGVGTGYYGRSGGVGVGQSVSSGRSGQYLRLTFDPAGTLTHWEKIWR